MADTPPTLFDYLGGAAALERLFTSFYRRVPDDPVLAPVFAAMDPRHASHVAAFVGEVFGGPERYSESHGGHAHMIARHLDKHLDQVQRRRWVELLLECADAEGLPDDPEFRSALVAYLEWGSRLAVMNSQPGAAADADQPMPRWGWGEARGPYVPKV